MTQKNKVPAFLAIVKNIKENASRYVASESVKFFRESFVKHGFTDTSFKPWQKSNSPLVGKRTLYQSGKLMRSVKKQLATLEKVVVIADTEYAQIQNEGGFIVVTAQMKKYFWAMYMNYKDRNRLKASYCKAMALKKEGSKIKIPKHQFIGESKTMMQNFDTWFKNNIETEFKNIDLNSI